MIKYNSVKDLADLAIKEGKNISDIVLNDQALQTDMSLEDVYNTMLNNLNVMRSSVVDGMNPNLKSASGLSGGSAHKMKTAVDSGNSICGPLLGNVLTRALAVSELNACTL